MQVFSPASPKNVKITKFLLLTKLSIRKIKKVKIEAFTKVLYIHQVFIAIKLYDN